MSEAQQSDSRKPAAVYVSWVTFRHAIEQLVEGVPNQIDRTVFAGLSGAVWSQLFTGFKFLGLVRDDGKPTPELQRLAVEDEDERKKRLETILRDRYADLFALDLSKTTTVELLNQLEQSYGVTGDTRERALRFFLGAMNYLGIAVSRHVRRPTGTIGATPRRRRSPRPRTGSPDDPEEDEAIQPSGSTGTSRSITLKSGGTVTLSASVDFLALSPNDRAFLYDLIDKLAAYEQGTENDDE